MTKASEPFAQPDPLPAARANPYAWWDQPGPYSARTRLRQPGPFAVHHVPKFHLGAHERLFTIGSCFARRIESMLASIGVDLLVAGFELPQHYYDGENSFVRRALSDPLKREELVREPLNRYSVLSIQREFERALGPPDTTADLVEVEPERWYDCTTRHLLPLPLADAREVRRRIDETTRKVRDATVVLITLGMTETWIDQQTGNAIVSRPPSRHSMGADERFVSINLTHAEVLTSLETTLELLRRSCPRGIKFVLTVSPVPLYVSFHSPDVMTGNSYSKATLRSAAQEIVLRHADVDYYPAFEMVAATRTDDVWSDDTVHVRREVAAIIARRFVSSYFTSIGGVP